MARKIITSSKSAVKGNLGFYHLPKGLLTLTLKEVFTGSQKNLTIDFEAQTIPDPSQRYYLIYHANPFVDDDINITFTEEGYLASINTTIKDETLTIVDKVIETATDIAAGGTGLRSIGEERILMQETFDPFDGRAMRRINNMLEARGTGFEVSIKSPYAESGKKSKEEEVNPEEVNGIFCRPEETYEVIVSKGEAELRKMVKMPNPHVLHVVEIPHARYVSNTFNLTMERGYPKSIIVKKPSQALAMVQIPLKIVKAIMSIPAMLFSIKINYDTEKQKYLTAEENSRKFDLEYKEREREFEKKLALAREAEDAAREAAKEKEEENNSLKKQLAEN